MCIKKRECHLRRKICSYTEAPILLSLLFGLLRDELSDVAVNLILLCALLGTDEPAWVRTRPDMTEDRLEALRLSSFIFDR